MPYIFMEDAQNCFLASSKVAFWRKPLSGDKFAPYKNPIANIDLIRFHSDLYYYGVVAKDLARVINHAAVAGLTTNVGNTGTIVVGQQAVSEYVLINHNLGYVPLYMVALDGQIIPQGLPIQQEGGGGARFVSSYATTSAIVLRDVGFSSASTLPAQNRTYSVLVFRSPAADPGLPMFHLAPGEAIFGHGKWQLDQNHLRQVGPGDSPFSNPEGPTMAIRNGGMGARLSNGGVVTVGAFNGTYPNPPFISVGI